MLINEIRNKLKEKTTKTCRICADTSCEKGDKWIHPCNCKGSLLWCHENCLKTWLKYSNSQKCSICSFKFNIIFKNSSNFKDILKKHFGLFIYLFYCAIIIYLSVLTTSYEKYFIVFLSYLIKRTIILIYIGYLFIYYLVKRHNSLFDELNMEHPFVLIDNHNLFSILYETYNIFDKLGKKTFNYKCDYSIDDCVNYI